MSENQKKYEANINSSGGVYLVVRNMDSFIDWYDDFVGDLLTSQAAGSTNY